MPLPTDDVQAPEVAQGSVPPPPPAIQGAAGAPPPPPQQTAGPPPMDEVPFSTQPQEAGTPPPPPQAVAQPPAPAQPPPPPQAVAQPPAPAQPPQAPTQAVVPQAPPQATMPQAPPQAVVPQAPPQAPPQATVPQAPPMVHQPPPEAAAPPSNVTTLPSAAAPPAAVPAAPAPQGSQLAVSGGGDLVAQAEADGFKGLHIGGFGTFPMVKLEQGEFLAGELGSLGSEFYCTMMTSREKFLITNGLAAEDPGSEFRFSYDMKKTHKNEDLKEVMDGWKAMGLKPAAKKYLEIPARVYYGQHDGKVVLLSIPPASVDRWSSYWVQLKFSNKRMQEVVTRISKGKRVEGKNISHPFYPWQFDEWTG